MNNTTYYLPIKSANLAHYFAKGCVCPTKYIENRNEDIQNIFNNALLLSKSTFTEDTNCSLEIVLNDKDEKAKKITENFFFFDSALPISRVKKIIFKDEKQKTNTIYDITSGAAFLPSKLIEVHSNSKDANSNELKKTQINQSDKNWSSKIDLFNRIMGGFAIMRISGDKFQNYPLNYFNTLANINSIIKDEIVNQSIDVTNNYDWTIINNDKFQNLHNAIYSTINNSVVESFAKNDKINLSKQNGKYLLHKIDHSKTTYLVAVLASYGQGARMNLDTFISDLISDQFPEKKKEGLALIFGINKGYETFRNRYKTNSFQVDVKFKLDSQLDYYTIESIYQFVFNQKKYNSTFEYIDNWCPKQIEDKQINGIKTYQVLDKTILYKKKEEDGFLSKLFQNSSRNDIYQKIVLEIQKWIPTYLIEKNNTEGLKHFKDLLERDFEQYTNEIVQKVSNEIHNKNSSKLQVLNKENSNLRNIVKNKDNEITKLKEDIQKFSLRTYREDERHNIKESKIRINESSIDHKKQDSLKSDLFSNEPLSGKDTRAKELLKIGITKLKKIAKERNISNLNKYKKDNIQDLVDVILSKEFN
jgi:hypothetical protein